MYDVFFTDSPEGDQYTLTLRRNGFNKLKVKIVDRAPDGEAAAVPVDGWLSIVLCVGGPVATQFGLDASAESASGCASTTRDAAQSSAFAHGEYGAWVEVLDEGGTKWVLPQGHNNLRVVVLP